MGRECPYDDVDWEQFKHFHELADHIESRDQCMGIGSYMFSIQDVDNNMKLDKCEHMYGCLAVEYEEGQTEEEEEATGVKCAKLVTKWTDMLDGDYTLKTVGEVCAEHFPTLEHPHSPMMTETPRVSKNPTPFKHLNPR